MAMTCKACRHPQRKAIDEALLGPESLPSIAARFGIAARSLARHKSNCLSRKMQAAMTRYAAEGRSLADEAMEVVRLAREILQSSDDADIKLKALDRITRGLDLRGRSSGEIMAANVAALLASLGVNGEDELRRIVERDRSVSGSLDDAERDAVAALQLVIGEHPERLGRIIAAIGGEREVAAEVPPETPRLP